MEKKNGYRSTDLFLAAIQPDSEAAKHLMRTESIDPNIHEKIYGCTPLHLASSTGNIDIIRTFLRFGADPMVSDKNLLDPVDYLLEHYVFYRDYTKMKNIVDLFRKYGYRNFNSIDMKSGRNKLHTLARNGCYRAFELFKRYGSDPYVKDHIGNIPGHYFRNNIYNTDTHISKAIHVPLRV